MNIIEEMRYKGITMTAVAYARFSSDNQKEESIDAQLRAISEFATNYGITIVREYVDKAISAKTANREAFQQMIEDSKNKSFNLVLVHKLDRFARTRNDSYAYGLALRRSGVTLVSITELFDDSPESKILQAVIEAMNEYYIDNLSREVKKGLKENALKCMFTGGVPPFGYKVNDATKLLEVEESERHAVELIFNSVLEGKGYSGIADELNTLGVRTRSGNTFQKTSLLEIIRNEKYKGVYIYNRASAVDQITNTRNNHLNKPDEEIIRKEGGVPAIISEEDFDAVQDILKNRKHQMGNAKATEIYLLSGKIYCGKCRATYEGNRKRSGRARNILVTYRCGTRGRKTSKACDNKEVNRDYLERFVLERLSEQIFDDDLVPLIAERYEKFMETYIDSAQNKVKMMKKGASKLQKEIRNLVNAVAATGDMSLAEGLQGKRDDLTRLQYDIDNEEATLSTSKLPVDQLLAAMEHARDMLRSGELAQTRQLINLYIKKVLVYNDKVEVYMNPIPTMNYLTNLDDFLEDFIDNTGYSNLERIEIWREKLNTEGGKQTGA